ncbi:MAG: bifunctional dTDP-4-dehydrorhamnose 3,5-epimerase family protein/NAD(P)-dependent oxidoreductase [Actinobacteria bacterium]|jgi:dTDP-4-dehydrorhamnose 3,5-epimerase/reductase|nr:bifunctional dTDP-4-dehydrorhamnose 3,5-epimerase family protein/NAD(P)-dependent oxidoreductase [Actinomycetota bacterium]MBU2111242.1 bifunctional dTDP-4-dehydrorhamnose 3,5-epimerase family protein/NAD(P)-dependent oxidoreductase [Actinomycetota bacterium]
MVELVETPIPDLVVLRLEIHEDSRGWFKENWQREKMLAAGLPDFGPVQNNMSLNAHRGATRGIHTEPWDKLVSVATGRVFAAWVDMREGPSFGTVFHLEMGPDTAVFVPRGVGNSYQALEDGTVYSYLVNDHWRPGIAYPALHLGDPTCAIPWPIPLDQAEISEKDHSNPTLDAVTPVAPKKTLIIGANGQLGRALHDQFPGADLVDLVADPDRDVTALDASDPTAIAAMAWRDYGVVLNAAAYTSVDAAETPEGRVTAWQANATAPALLARAADEHGFTLVHYSSEYVFDGTRELHTEDEPLSPLGVYAQSKAAGDIAVSTSRRHYLIRTSWVVGEGRNFVRTMLDLAARGVSPAVVDDQLGRLTFTDELVRATKHLLASGAEFGTYNVSNGGQTMSWYDVAAAVFDHAGREDGAVSRTTTEAYAAGKDLAPRPAHSVLDLTKLAATGFTSLDGATTLGAYCRKFMIETG